MENYLHNVRIPKDLLLKFFLTFSRFEYALKTNFDTGEGDMTRDPMLERGRLNRQRATNPRSVNATLDRISRRTSGCTVRQRVRQGESTRSGGLPTRSTLIGSPA